jgi:hypothetical protein
LKLITPSAKSELPLLWRVECWPLARTGTEGRAGGEGTGAHAEAGAEGRGDVAEVVTTTGAVAVAAEGSGEIGAHPLAAGFAERINTLHGETGQVLHVVSLRDRELGIAEPPGGRSPRVSPIERRPRSKDGGKQLRQGRAGTVRMMGRIVAR